MTLDLRVPFGELLEQMQQFLKLHDENADIGQELRQWLPNNDSDDDDDDTDEDEEEEEDDEDEEEEETRGDEIEEDATRAGEGVSDPSTPQSNHKAAARTGSV